MQTVLAFLIEHPAFSSAMAVINTIIVWPVITKTVTTLYTYASDAAGKSRFTTGASIYSKGRETVLRYFDEIVKKSFIEGILERSCRKLRKAGYHTPNSLLCFLLLKYLLPLLVFIIALRVNYSNIAKPLVASLLIAVSVEIGIRKKKKTLEKQFNRNAYKIYKYLHNQVKMI
jgi:hypothetical protein